MASRPISPAEPTKKHPPLIQPNAHPYAIKTTSSALLSRSNSSPHSTHHTRHNYVPSSRIPIGTKVRHHHSSSQSSVEAEVHRGVRTIPMPFSTPPSVVVALPDNSSVSLNRASEPKLVLPSNAAAAVTGNHKLDQKHTYNRDRDSVLGLYTGLPPNPKQWNTDQLVTYLETSLRSGKNADRDKDGSLVGILEYVRTCGLTGRELLRLTDANLAGTPLSDVQCTQLLDLSRVLRAEVLRGRIYVDSHHLENGSDTSRPTCYPSPFHSIHGASLSADDVRLLPDNNTGEDTLLPAPAMSLHRSSSVLDASAQRYKDLARMRVRRRGKVKGLVETWERTSTSGSDYSLSDSGSVSETESESETDPEFGSILNAKHSPESPRDPPSVVHDEPPYDASSPAANSVVVLQKSPLLTPPLPYTHTYTTPVVVGNDEGEPSIEELLASSSSIPVRGARAWEADFGLGETVKRIPVSASADACSPPTLVMEPDTSCSENDGGQSQGDPVQLKASGVWGSTTSATKQAKVQHRVVTAIFTGSLSDNASETVGDEMVLVDRHPLASGANGIVRDGAPARSDRQNDSDSSLRRLEESIAVTRAEVDAFRLRLEKIEADTARREAELEQAQYSDSRRSSEFELKRRSRGDKQAMHEAAELSRDEILAKGLRSTDILGGWETMSMGDITRAIVARTMGWVFPYGHVGAPARGGRNRSQDRIGVKERYPSPAKKCGSLSVVRRSYNMILFSFAICAAVLRRMGFGRWLRRP